jgi:hypothetical protein
MGKASRAKRQARELRSQEMATQAALMRRVEKSLPDERVRFVNRRTGPKVSDLLVEFASPWLDEAENENQWKVVIEMAILAWNLSTLPEPERSKEIRENLGPKLGTAGEIIVKEMLARKLSRFPEQQQFLVDYEVSGSGPNLRVEVAYTPSPQEVAKLKPREEGLEGR